jgi:hypothetical protein
MDIKGARVLAARIAESGRLRDLKKAHASSWERRCVECGGEIAEVLAALGSIRCHDCRAGHPAA